MRPYVEEYFVSVMKATLGLAVESGSICGETVDVDSIHQQYI